MGGKNKKKSKGKPTAENGSAKGQNLDDATRGNAPKTEERASGNHFPGEESWDGGNTSQKEVKDERNDLTRSDSWRDSKKREHGREFSNSNYKGGKERDGGGGYKSRQSEPYRNKGYEEDRRTDRKRSSLNENERGGRGPRDSSNNRRKYRSNFYQDSEFRQYEDEFASHKGHIDYVKTKEVVSDLFEVPDEYSLAHCVAEDMNMGSGIAVQFRYQFKRVDELLNQHQSTGGLAILTDKERYIYYLVTKKFSTGKPTYGTLFSSLKALRHHVIEKKVEQIAMPRIGCGLDRLEWENVKFMVEFLFRDVNVDITVCNLEPMEESSPQQRHRNCRVTHEKYPIEKIDVGTVILYFSSEDEHISDEMRNLDEKFHFLTEFRYAKKIKSNPIIYTKNQNYLICGCIVRKTKQDKFDFIAFQKCLQLIQKENKKKCNFYYYAFQAMNDENDDCLNYKIINILRNSLREVEVYVCWPGDLQNEMTPRDRFGDEKSDETWRPKNNSFASNWRGADKEKSFTDSSSKTSQRDNYWTPESKGSTIETNESQWDSSIVTATSTTGEDTESNSAWFQYCSTPKLYDNRQNFSLGSLEHGEVYTNSWSDSEEHNSSFAYLEQSWECGDNNWSESKSEIEISQNLSFGVSEREYYCYPYKGETENSSPEKEIKSSSHSDWASSDSHQQSNSSQYSDREKLDESSPPSTNNEYESFQLDLEKGSISPTLKEQKVPDSPKQYSRVCYAREDLIIQNGVAPGDDISPQIGKLLNQKAQTGGLAFAREGNNFLYCLIVSPPNQPPTAQSVFSAIQKLRDHTSKNRVKKLMIPVLKQSDGGLSWSETKNMFQYLLGRWNIDMVAATFDQIYDASSLLAHNKSKLTHGKSAIHQMKKKSVIIYLASVDGQFTEEMNGLAKKFDFRKEFQRKPKALGDVIKYKENEDHVLYGCVVLRNSSIDFEELRRCVCEVNKKNQEEKLPNVGIQAGKDQSVNFKILTVLLHCLEGVNIVMCWPGDLRSLMPAK